MCISPRVSRGPKELGLGPCASQNGGTISDEDIDIDTQEYEFDGPYEVSFTDLAFADIFTIHPDFSPELKCHGD